MTTPEGGTSTFEATCQEAYELLGKVVPLVESLDPPTVEPINQEDLQRFLIRGSVARKTLKHLSIALATLAQGARP